MAPTVTLTQIRAGIATRLATITGLSAHATAPGQICPPAAIVLPGKPLVEWDEACAGGLDTWRLRVMVLAQRADDPLSQQLLDAYLARGAACVKTAVEADGTLGGIVSYTWVSEVSEYGPIEYGGVMYMSATWELEVTT